MQCHHLKVLAIDRDGSITANPPEVNAMQKEYKDNDELTVKEIWKFLGRKVCIRKIYYLIENGTLAPAIRYSGSRGTCVPYSVVLAYKQSCVLDVGA